MTVAELIAALQALPPDVEVYYYQPPTAGTVFGEHVEPRPHVEEDGCGLGKGPVVLL